MNIIPTYTWRELRELVPPIVQDTQRTDNHERRMYISLSKIGVKCDRLKCLDRVVQS